MKRECLFTMPSPYRDEFRIHGFRFGYGRKAMAIVGPMRGDELQQQYVCSQLVKTLRDLEEQGMIAKDNEILVIPSANPFSMNIGKRFWAMDNTDVNRMFPGYDLGETTQRIAAAIFEHIKDFPLGLQLASHYVIGDFVPHVRMMHTGFEKLEQACDFGMPYTVLRAPSPIDTCTLNYNWQIWEAQAYSMYCGHTSVIDGPSADMALASILRFMARREMITYHARPGYQSQIIHEADLTTVKARRAGILYCLSKPDDLVRRDQPIARIIDPYDGSVRCDVLSPVDGTIFFAHNRALVLESTLLFKIIPA